MEQKELDQLALLATKFSAMKVLEDEYKARRIAIETEIAVLIPGPEKGQKTVELPDGDKLTVKRDLSYKADCESIRKHFALIVPPLSPPVQSKTIWTLDEVGYEWYRKEHPLTFSKIALMVEVKPKKTAVTLKKKV